ncbi:MAG: DUF92 domain-containing protein [Acidobacteriaceae bacterium]
MRNPAHQLPWQSWVVLAAVVPWCSIAALRYAITAGSSTRNGIALGISLALTLLVLLVRAATPPAAMTGGVITAVLTIGAAAWYRSAFPALLAVCVLTTAATRFGRARKQQMGLAENHQGRNAAQIAANLGAAGLVSGLALSLPSHSWFCMASLVAALAEAAADTLASELGEVLGGQPFLVTTLRRVAPGTDGAISVAGTGAGAGAAGLIVLLACPTLGLTRWQAFAAGTGAVAGLFVDSLLGATAERRGWLNNDAVNFLSTIAAAAIALALLFCAFYVGYAIKPSGS